MNDLERILNLAGVKYEAPVAEETNTTAREFKEGAGADICDHCGCDINNPAQGCTCDHTVEESSCGSKKKHKHESIEEELEEAVNLEEEPNEGNDFSGKRQAAIDAGKDEFEVDGKKYKVKKNQKKLKKSQVKNWKKHMLLFNL